MTTVPSRPLRADARRNREAILASAAELFGHRGDDAQIEEIAAHAGLGVGTVYRHFADKQALIAAIVGRRFETATELALAAEQLPEPGEAFDRLLYGYLESVNGDAAFRRALLGPEEPRWEAIAAQKSAFREAVARIVARAVGASLLRPDFSADDFILVTRGAMANMPDDAAWRRHVALQLEGIRPAGPAR
jgi:AcrR family transcriptional regulator